MSNLRPRDDLRNAPQDFKSEYRHREPDAGILDHERKRKVEVKCLELQLQLEEDESMSEEQVQEHVSALRNKLLAAGQPVKTGKL